VVIPFLNNIKAAEIRMTEYITPEQYSIAMEPYKQYCLGTANRCGSDPVLIYDMDAIIGHIMDEDGMPYHEAVEYFDINIMGAWQGEMTPFFLNPVEREDVL